MIRLTNRERSLLGEEIYTDTVYFLKLQRCIKSSNTESQLKSCRRIIFNCRRRKTINDFSYNELIHELSYKEVYDFI